MDEEHEMCCNNAKKWEQVLSQKENSGVEDYKDQCTKSNFGVSNFGLNPLFLSLNKMLYDVGLRMLNATVRKMHQCFRQDFDRHDNNDN